MSYERVIRLLMLKMVNLEVLVYYEHLMDHYQSYYPSAAELARSSRLSGGVSKRENSMRRACSSHAC